MFDIYHSGTDPSICEGLDFIQVATIQVWMVLAEEGYRKMQMNGPVRHEDNGNPAQWKAVKQRRKRTGKRSSI